VPTQGPTNSADSPAIVSVAIGQWTVAAAPAKVRTLLGSCVGVVLYDRVAKLGGLAHIVRPSSRGAIDHPG
jgi:chemotaxis protein CheD